MPAVGVGISPFFGRLTPSEAVAYYTRVKAGGGTIDDFSALVGLTLDYQRIASLNPSLYTFASGRKSGTQYSLIPTDGSGDFSVTRSGTTGMELNAQGYWQPVGENVPRYDYVSGVPMINIEEARTNLISRYKSFAHSDWTKSGARIEGDLSTAGADILAGWDFTVGWTATSATINDSNTFTSTSSGGLYKNIGLIAGKLYKVTIAGSSSVTVGLRNSAGAGINTIGDGFGTYYFIAVDASIYVRNSAAGTTDITTITIQEVTGYASPFVDASGNNLMSGYKLVEGTNNGEHSLVQANSISLTALATYTFTFFAMPSGRTRIKHYEDLWWGTLQGCVFILEGNGSTSSNGMYVVSSSCVLQNNGFYKCSITYTLNGSQLSTKNKLRLVTTGTTDSYQGDGVSGIYISHAQLEAGTVATSPIGGAEGSSQTRNADAIVKTGASALIGQTEGTIILDLSSSFLSDDVFTLNRSGNSVVIYKSNSVLFSFRIYYASTSFALTPFDSTGISRLKIGFSYKSGNSVVYINGNLHSSSTDTFNFTGSLDNIYVGSPSAYFAGIGLKKIASVQLYKTRLSNAQLAALTTL